MGLSFKEEKSIINTSQVSKKARHLWLWEVEKLMTTTSGLWRDRRLFSWSINNLALSCINLFVTLGMELPFLNMPG